MKKYVRKFYLSIMLVVLSVLTMVATTYAWVGLLTGTTFDEFTINLQDHESKDASEYGIELSLDGIHFADQINPKELKRYLLYNTDPTGVYKDYLKKDLNGNYIINDNLVERDYVKLRVDQCTVERPENPGGELANRLGYFKNIRGERTTNFLKFDLYLSIYKLNSSDDDTSEKKLDLYLRGNKPLFVANDNSNGIYNLNLFNAITYPSAIGEYRNNAILGNGTNQIKPNQMISGNVKVDITNSCRMAIEKFKAMPKGDPSVLEYDDDEIFIFQTGSIYPTYNQYTGVYDFGGILPSEYNFARLYYNTIYKQNPLGEVPDLILRRGDTIYQDDGIVNHIINQNDGVTTAKMVCLRIYFWFEGWDSDCFEVIDNKTVTMNLMFNTKGPNEE